MCEKVALSAIEVVNLSLVCESSGKDLLLVESVSTPFDMTNVLII